MEANSDSIELVTMAVFGGESIHIRTSCSQTDFSLLEGVWVDRSRWRRRRRRKGGGGRISGGGRVGGGRRRRRRLGWRWRGGWRGGGDERRDRMFVDCGAKFPLLIFENHRKPQPLCVVFSPTAFASVSELVVKRSLWLVCVQIAHRTAQYMWQLTPSLPRL